MPGPNKTIIIVPGGGGGGSGDVTGPASSTDNAIARYDGTTGKIIQNSSATIADDGTLSATSVSAGASAFTGINVNGTGGNGHVHLKHQSVDPTSQASSTTIFADSNGNPAWINDGLSKVTLDGDGITANRSYTLPDASGTLALTTDIVPGGADTQVQFNDGGVFGGDARFTFDKSTGGTTGGDFSVEAGASVDGGGAGFYAQGGRVGSGGLIQAYAGGGTGTDADGGDFEFIAGAANGVGNGGRIKFSAGISPSGIAGDIEFQSGAGPTPGKYLFRTTNELYTGELDFESLTADRTITFQDASGTVAYLSDIPAGVLKLPTYTVGASGADYPGFTDTAIQAALDAGNGKIYLTDGTYVLSTGLKFKSNYQYIVGNGEKCIIQFNGATVPTAISPNATNLKQGGIKGVSIQQTNATVQGTALDLSDMAIMDIDVEIKDAGVAVKMNDANNNTFYNRVYVKAFGCIRGIEMNGANPANHNYFSGRIANKSGGDYGIYIVKGQGNHFEDMSLEPAATTGNTGIYLTSASAYSNTFENMWIEGNNVGVTIDSSVTYNTFVGGTITSNTTNFTNNGKNTSVFNTQIGSVATTILQPFTATDTGNASSTVETITNNTSFAHVSSKLVSYELKNGSDTSKVLEIKNAGTGNSISVMQGASEVMSVEENGKTNVASLKIGSSSTTGYVWTATDTIGNGSWQAASGGGSGLTQAQVLSRLSIGF